MGLKGTQSTPITIHLTGVLSYLLGKRKCEISTSCEINYIQLMEALSNEIEKPLFLKTHESHWILGIQDSPTMTFSITLMLNGSRWIPNASENTMISPGASIQMLAPIGGG